MRRGRGLGLGGSRLLGAFSLAPHSLLHRSHHPLPTVQPDPPVNIKVICVDRNPHWLRVTWQDPPSWNSHFYRLQFELRYRAEKSKTFTTVAVRPPGPLTERWPLDAQGRSGGSWKGSPAAGSRSALTTRTALERPQPFGTAWPDLYSGNDSAGQSPFTGLGVRVTVTWEREGH